MLEDDPRTLRHLGSRPNTARRTFQIMNQADTAMATTRPMKTPRATFRTNANVPVRASKSRSSARKIIVSTSVRRPWVNPLR